MPVRLRSTRCVPLCRTVSDLQADYSVATNAAFRTRTQCRVCTVLYVYTLCALCAQRGTGLQSPVVQCVCTHTAHSSDRPSSRYSVGVYCLCRCGDGLEPLTSLARSSCLPFDQPSDHEDCMLVDLLIRVCVCYVLTRCNMLVVGTPSSLWACQTSQHCFVAALLGDSTINAGSGSA